MGGGYLVEGGVLATGAAEEGDRLLEEGVRDGGVRDLESWTRIGHALGFWFKF